MVVCLLQETEADNLIWFIGQSQKFLPKILG